MGLSEKRAIPCYTMHTPQMALWINHHNPLEKSRFSMVFPEIFSYQVPLLPLFAWLSEEKVAFKSQGIPIFHSGSSFLDTRKATGWALYSVWSFLDYVGLFITKCWLCLTISDCFWLFLANFWLYNVDRLMACYSIHTWTQGDTQWSFLELSVLSSKKQFQNLWCS
jgi:hypothetical protein